MTDLVNIKKPSSNAGAGGGIVSEIIYMLADGIDTLPTRDADKISISADIQFKPDFGMHTLYSTSDKIDYKQTIVGETDGKATQLSLTISHPGFNLALETFMEEHLNDNFILGLKHHDTGRIHLLGDLGQPMVVSESESTYGATPEASTFTTITFKGGNKRAAIYKGAVTIVPDPVMPAP